MRQFPTTVIATALFQIGTAVAAAGDGALEFCLPVPEIRVPPLEGELEPGAVRAEADEFLVDSVNVTRLQGNIAVRNQDSILSGDSAKYDQRSGEIEIRGGVSYLEKGLLIDSKRARMRMDKGSGTFHNADFFFSSFHSFGSAERIEILDSEHAHLYQLRYTTCAPEDPDWYLKADRLILDRSTNTGEAWHTSFFFMGVPFFYSPYINFPLEGRKSGLLPPTFGTSESNGIDISLPIYWNIAPNMDATITLRNISKRDEMVLGEYRYLGQSSRATIDGGYMGSDKIYADKRSYFNLNHRASFGAGWSSIVNWRQVSDREVFRDNLVGSGTQAVPNYLERRVDLVYGSNDWYFRARAQEYQALYGAPPYRRLPQLRLASRQPQRRNQANLAFTGEVVRFAHETRITTGERLDLVPSISLPLEGVAWYVTPKLAWRYTGYRLNDSAAEERLERSLPIASLDSGLFFERTLRLSDSPYTQTLEPRLFYLRVPYEDQDDLPMFDTGERVFDFGQLFSDNRFSGADRQGDADQIATAITSRIINERDGREWLRLSIGQIQYYSDRRVTMKAGQPTAKSTTSDLISEIDFNPLADLNIGVTGQWDHRNDRKERLNTRLRYSLGRDREIRLNYHYDRTKALRYSDLALRWPLSQRWRLLAAHRRDLESGSSLETIGGLEHRNCCWALQLVAAARRDNIEEELERSFYVTLEFKGLATLGRDLEERIGRGMLFN